MQPKSSKKLDQVFGISSKPVLSYFERTDVDGRFVEAVESSHHIVVYGSSKQGKTALRQKHVEEKNCIVYRCNPKSTPEAVYQYILRDAGVRVSVTESRSEAFSGSGGAEVSVNVNVPWVGDVGVALQGGGEKQTQRVLETAYVAVSLSDAQIVASLLQESKFKKFVVLENFHYLSRDVQKSLSYDLKTFHEMSIRFILLGIWREANQLLVLNPDLQDRISEVPVEPWTEVDFREVIEAGQTVLNVVVPGKAVQEFVKNAYGNVGMVQEFLKAYCLLNNVHETSVEHKVLDDGELIDKALSKKSEDQRGRLITMLRGISAKSRTDSREGGRQPLTLPYYLVQVLLTAPIAELCDGITRRHLLDRIRELHRREDKETIRVNDVAHLLQRLAFLQQDPTTPFLYYDTLQQRLRIVDAGLLFALAKVDRDKVREEILDPLATYDEPSEESLLFEEHSLGEGIDPTDRLM